MTLLKGLSPAYLRIGGTAADLVTFSDDNVTRYNINDSEISLMNTNSWINEDNICVKNKLDELYMSRTCQVKEMYGYNLFVFNQH